MRGDGGFEFALLVEVEMIHHPLAHVAVTDVDIGELHGRRGIEPAAAEQRQARDDCLIVIFADAHVGRDGRPHHRVECDDEINRDVLAIELARDRERDVGAS